MPAINFIIIAVNRKYYDALPSPMFSPLKKDFFLNAVRHLQELQDPLLQDVQPDDDAPARGLSTPLMAKVESFFFTSSDEHFGQLTALFPKTSFSNSSSQVLH